MRKAYDFYATPKISIEKLLDNIELPNKNIIKTLENSAGNGNIIRELLKLDKKFLIHSVEIRSEEKEVLNDLSSQVTIGDFLELNVNEKYDLIIGNPPYSLALEFVEKSLPLLNENGKLIYLLRTGFLESKKRFDFWQKNPLSELLVLSSRPSFTGKGTDATSYSWFVWENNGSKEQKIKII